MLATTDLEYILENYQEGTATHLIDKGETQLSPQLEALQHEELVKHLSHLLLRPKQTHRVEIKGTRIYLLVFDNYLRYKDHRAFLLRWEIILSLSHENTVKL